VTALIPRPFCGVHRHYLDAVRCRLEDSPPWTAHVYCRGCGARGPEAHGLNPAAAEEAASIAWNRRAP